MQIQERQTPTWLLPVVGGFIIVAAWFISFYFSQQVGDKERAAFSEARQAQVASCERVNVLREETNVAIEVMQEFLVESASNIQRLAEFYDEPEDVDRRFASLESASRLREMVPRLNTIPIPDCEEVIAEWHNIRFMEDEGQQAFINRER